LRPDDPLHVHEFLAVADTSGTTSDARVFLAAPVVQLALEAAFASHIVEEDIVVWDEREDAVAARSRRRLGQLVLADRPRSDADPAEIAQAVLTGIRRLGINVLPWTDDLRQWQRRVLLLHRLRPDDGWPEVGDATLLDSLDAWLSPYLTDIRRRSQFDRIPLRQALQALLPWPLPKKLDALAPERLQVPSGSNVALRYEDDGPPVLAVKLQEVFGLTESPRIADGQVAVTMELLSPARRPLAVTGDLRSFWGNAYPQVRAEMRGRYPKHDWPEDPLTAIPTSRAKRRPG
jgi:ATP-dependent helicase HrpB